VKALILSLSGLATAVAGAVIRACEQAARTDMAADLASAFCLPGMTHPTIALSHQHCAGCVMLFAGVAMMIAAPVVHRLPALRRTVARSRA